MIYLQSFLSVLLIDDDSQYMFKFKDIRWLSLIFSYVTIMAWLVGVSLEVYLIFFLQDGVSMIMSLYLGYFLLISITILPETIIIVVKEKTQNMLDRSEIWSTPGQYFSILEWIMEELGFYG